MDQIGLEARGLGSCSGNRVLGLIQLWRRTPPWVLCLFSQPTAKKETISSQPVSFFFLSLRKQIYSSLGKRVYHFLCRLLLHLPQKSTGSTSQQGIQRQSPGVYLCWLLVPLAPEPTWNPTTIPLSTVSFRSSLQLCDTEIDFSFWMRGDFRSEWNSWVQGRASSILLKGQMLQCLN